MPDGKQKMNVVRYQGGTQTPTTALLDDAYFAQWWNVNGLWIMLALQDGRAVAMAR